jgi:hypothetical protein
LSLARLFHLSFYILFSEQTLGTLANSRIDATGVSTAANWMLNLNNSAQRINQGTTSQSASVDLSGTGLKAIIRDSSTNTRFYNKATEITRTSTSTVVLGNSQWLLRGTSSYSDVGLSFGFNGSALTQTQIQDFRTAYNNYLDEHIITVICNGFHNSVDSIVTFVKYHINLGVNRIVIHYREGNNIKTIYDILQKYIKSEKVILIDWKGKIKFYQDIRKDQSNVGLGEVAHMNHSLNVFKEGKYLTWLNIDQLLSPPIEVLNLTEYLDNLNIEYNSYNSGGFILDLIDFKQPNDDLKYYESKEVINNISPFPQLTYFIKNVEVISSHVVTLGPNPIKILKKSMAVNHYPFLDNSRSFNNDVVEYLDNLNINLFN